jgi:hypothetical protein
VTAEEDGLQVSSRSAVISVLAHLSVMGPFAAASACSFCIPLALDRRNKTKSDLPLSQLLPPARPSGGHSQRASCQSHRLGSTSFSSFCNQCQNMVNQVGGKLTSLASRSSSCSNAMISIST